MALIEFLQKLFCLPTEIKEKPLKTIKSLGILDSVWIKENDIIYEGFVFDITRRCIIVVYDSDLRDYRFRIDKNPDAIEIVQDNKILYCNKPKESYLKIIR